MQLSPVHPRTRLPTSIVTLRKSQKLGGRSNKIRPDNEEIPLWNCHPGIQWFRTRGVNPNNRAGVVVVGPKLSREIWSSFFRGVSGLRSGTRLGEIYNRCRCLLNNESFTASNYQFVTGQLLSIREGLVDVVMLSKRIYPSAYRKCMWKRKIGFRCVPSAHCLLSQFFFIFLV